MLVPPAARSQTWSSVGVSDRKWGHGASWEAVASPGCWLRGSRGWKCIKLYT